MTSYTVDAQISVILDRAFIRDFVCEDEAGLILAVSTAVSYSSIRYRKFSIMLALSGASAPLLPFFLHSISSYRFSSSCSIQSDSLRDSDARSSWQSRQTHFEVRKHFAV